MKTVTNLTGTSPITADVNVMVQVTPKDKPEAVANFLAGLKAFGIKARVGNAPRERVARAASHAAPEKEPMGPYEALWCKLEGKTRTKAMNGRTREQQALHNLKTYRLMTPKEIKALLPPVD